MNTRLNVKQFAIAWLAVFIILTIFVYVPTKLEIAPWFVVGQGEPPEAEIMTWRILTYLSRLIFAGLFTFIYTKTSEGKPGIGHGVRYGLGISLLTSLPGMFSPVLYFTWGAWTTVIQTVVGIIAGVICGAVVAKLYNPGKPVAA